jgi:lysophospholipase L1-like esterase
MRAGVFLLQVLLLTMVCSVNAADVPAGVKPAKRTQDFPWMSVAAWERMHAEDVLMARHDSVEVLFIGDSITAGWDSSLWQQHFAPLKAANFGIGGDHTGNVLWRLQHGAIGNLKPKLVVLLAGVNNFGHLQETPEQIAQGVASVVGQLQLAWPESRVLLNAVFPFEESAKSPRRLQVKKLNELLAALGDNKKVFFKDYGGLFLAQDGHIPAALMGDFLHPTTKGYELWANSMLPDIRSLLQL